MIKIRKLRTIWEKNTTRITILTKLSAFVVALALLAIAVPAASASEPVYDTAMVDGDYSEWDLTADFFADMYRAGDPTKKVESKLYLRYDCITNTMYALVLTVPDVPALQQPTDAWVAIDGVSNKVLNGNDINDGVPPDFAWVDDGTILRGYEASFSIMEGTYKLLAHVQVYDDDASQTSATDRKTFLAGIDLTIDCPDFTPYPSIDLEKYVSVDGGYSWWPADITPGPSLLNNSPISFKFVVTNNGNVALGPIQLTDIDPVVAASLSDCQIPNKLDPGEFFECVIGPFNATLRNGETNSTYNNTATASGKYQEVYYSHDDEAYYIVGAPAIIGNQVWQDMDGNGFQGVDEPWIDGVEVRLYQLDDCSDTTPTLYASVFTTEHGRYRFAVDPAYSYYLEFVPPAGYVITLKDQGTDDAFDSDADPVNGTTACITGLDYGVEDLTWDAGLYVPPQLGGDVWDDYNGNGIHDIFEPGINDSIVELYWCNDTLAMTTTTDAEGFYEFINLVPNQCYYVKFPMLSGYVFTLKDQGTTETMDSDADRISGKTIPVVLISGQNDLTWNAGYVLVQAGTGTPGYWKTHPEAWPVDSITIGGITYTKAQAIIIMNTESAKDVTYTAFRALVSAKLNVIMGNRHFCVDDVIASADSWMWNYRVGTGVRASSTAWKVGEPLFTTLDQYNNGYLCAPHRNFFYP